MAAEIVQLPRSRARATEAYAELARRASSARAVAARRAREIAETRSAATIAGVAGAPVGAFVGGAVDHFIAFRLGPIAPSLLAGTALAAVAVGMDSAGLGAVAGGMVAVQASQAGAAAAAMIAP